MEEDRSAFKILTGKPTGKKPSGRPKQKCENNIRIELKTWVLIRGIGLIRLRIETIGESL